MKPPRNSPRARNWGFDARRPRKDSHTLPAATDALMVLGMVSGACAVAGVADDRGDSLVLATAAVLLGAVGVLSHRGIVRRPRPATSTVMAALAAAWLALVVAGAVVYLSTGTIGRIDDALVESAAGFSTTAATTLDPSELSVSMTLWRASTQWVGGLLGLVAGVVVLPAALQQNRLTPTEWVDSGDFARDELRRRVVVTYMSLTVACGVAFAATGMGIKHSAVHGLTTISTGGFSSASDSFAGFGAGAAAVATVGMIVAGTGYAVIWWALRGRAKALFRSSELRIYGAILVLGTLLVWWLADGLSWHEALFTTASSASTTGFAITDWTVLDPSVTALVLVIFATGSMAGSAGGGLHISRSRILVAFARRELRRQLDPGAVVVLKSHGRAIDEPAVERVTGHQIAHFGTCACAAVLLAFFGVDLTGAIYTGVSVLSTHGPGIGVGPYGDLSGISQWARVSLVPFMLAGRLSLVPLMIAAVWGAQAHEAMGCSLRKQPFRARAANLLTRGSAEKQR